LLPANHNVEITALFKGRALANDLLQNSSALLFARHFSIQAVLLRVVADAMHETPTRTAKIRKLLHTNSNPTQFDGIG
jgi:hypothetical protein